jgi:hypothetical protein
MFAHHVSSAQSTAQSPTTSWRLLSRKLMRCAPRATAAKPGTQVPGLAHHGSARLVVESGEVARTEREQAAVGEALCSRSVRAIGILAAVALQINGPNGLVMN